jgi:SsrA-binding protein
MEKQSGTLIRNKKAGFDYEILKRFDAGLELLGFEVKSVRNGHGSLEGSHVTVRGGEAYLMNAHIPPFQAANAPKDYDPYRTRRVLLTKDEIGELAKAESQKGLTIVPFSLYNKGRKIKIEVNIVRGRKKFDKRDVLKKRDTEREVRREFSDR